MIKNILFPLLLFFSICFSQDTIKPEKIVVYPWPAASNITVPFCAYGLVDAPGNYEEYYKSYAENTKKLEDDHFDRKEKIFQDDIKTIYHLVFKHWIIGELFHLEEVHEKIPLSQGPMISYTLAYPGLEKASLWLVKKSLLEKTKSSWVGDKFKHLKIEIAFINMGQNRTRIYYRMELDAEDKRSLKAVEEEVFDGIANILKAKAARKK